TLYQDWDDQTVFMAGFSWAATSDLLLRFGANYASNPIPDQYLNCLFPAIVQKHLTAGLGYRINEASSIDLSVTRGFGETVTSGYSVTVKHSQWNGQIMYSHRF
ncbi:MAG: aromatic hydrocarbon degradation protein, partial [Verrucomicrobia bacterium]